MTAYKAYLTELGELTDGSEKLHVPGQWHKDSRTHAWVERASAWDQALLRTHGHDTVIALVAALRSTAHRILASLDRLEGPADWPQLLESLNTLSQLISPETVASALASESPVPAAAEKPGG